jgi:L-iditol 2-dehydrogenase
MAVETIPSKPNIGIYTNPNHDLWIADAKPSLEEVKSGSSLNPGEVTVEIRSTGICGYELLELNDPRTMTLN